MKRLIRYYLFLEQPLLVIIWAIILAAMVIICTLVIISTNDAILSTIYYYQTSDSSKQACLESAKHSDHIVIWRDETFMGFGKEGSYGCYLTVDEEKQGD